MKKLWILAFCGSLIVILLFLSYCLISSFKSTTSLGDIPDECVVSPLMVERVIDGDTFLLCSGDIIRLLCVDTPEKGKRGYEDAKDFLEELILYKQVNLVVSDYDVNKDKYDRLLRWVYIANESSETREKIFVNKYLLEEGYGDLMVIPPETCNKVAD